MNRETYCCRGKRMANYFLDHKCKLIRIDCDQKSKGYLVFIFEKNKNLYDALETWGADKDTYLIN